MNFELIYPAGLYVFVTFVGCAFLFQRWRCRRQRRLGRKQLGFYPRSASLGNALHQLHAIAEPQVQYVVEEKLKEEAEDDDAGMPVDPREHLLRQARRIRRGEAIERMTALRR